MDISWRFGFRRFWHPHIEGEDRYHFKEGFRVVATKFAAEEYGYIDTNNQIAFNRFFLQARSFSCGLARVQEKNGDWRYINTKGENAFSQTFTRCKDFQPEYKVAHVVDTNGFGRHIKTDGSRLYARDLNVICADDFRFRPELNAAACDVEIRQPNGVIIKCTLGLDGTILGER